MHSYSLGTVTLILDVCQHSYLKNSKSAPVSQYQLWMSLHKCACLPAGKTQKIPELPTQHISIQNRKLNRSFNCAWETIMESKRKSTQTFLRQVNLTTRFAPGKLPHDAQIGTFLPEENERPKGLRNYSRSLLWTENPAQGYLLLQGPTCYSIWVPFLLLTEFVSILPTCENNKDLPQTLKVSAVQQELKRSSSQRDNKDSSKWTTLH